MLKTVFHIHTDYSDDSNLSVTDLLTDARQQRVDCLAITDHDTIEGAREAAAQAGYDIRIIIGEEITTLQGHLIGLFLREAVEPGMSVRETAQAIREQNGLVVVPHPFNRLFGCGLNEHVYDILDLIDVVEVFNSQNLLAGPNLKAAEFAHRLGFPTVVGVDTHHRGHLDTCYQRIRPYRNAKMFAVSLRRARQFCRRHSLAYFLRSALVFAHGHLGLPITTGYGANCTQRRPTLLAPIPVGR